jgi:hypothetical protein
MTEILLKVALNTITLTPIFGTLVFYWYRLTIPKNENRQKVKEKFENTKG